MTEKYITLAEVKDLLTAENEKRELLTSQKNAMEHANTVSVISVEQANALIDEVMSVEGVTDSIAVKIADLLPQYPEDVRAIFSKERIALENATINQITEIVAKYV